MEPDLDKAGTRLPPWRGIAGFTFAVAALFAWMGAPQPPVLADVPSAPVIVVYGDSLTDESQLQIESSMTAAQPDARVVVRAHRGTAICDWFDSMRHDAALHADLVVLEFAGNVFTTCMVDRADSKRELIASYREDAARAVDIVRDGRRDTRIVFVATPRASTRPLTTGPNPLDAAYREVASRNDGVTFDLAPERALADHRSSLGNGSVFPAAMPCLADERGRSDCVDGRIEVRAADGIHFCPVEQGVSGPCSAYSSGVVRFGDAVASAALAALAG